MNSGTRFLTPVLLFGGLCLVAAAPARAADPQPPPETAQAAPVLNDAQLDQLLGPIALYPDALVALILPASTSPTDIVLADRYLDAKGDPAQIDNQPWSDSVRALARYPEVVQWMSDNLGWTRQLGDAFIAQPADIMNAVQRLRARARATGALVDTPEQQVVVDGDTIEIQPAQPEVIYVPRYDPAVVYVMQPPGYVYPFGPYISFGIGFPIGLWLTYDFDWHRRVIWCGDRHYDWRAHRDWRRHQPNLLPPNPGWRSWQPPVNRPPPPRDWRRHHDEVVTPHAFPGAPNYVPNSSRHHDGFRQPNTVSSPRGDRTDRPDRPAGVTPAPRLENTTPGVRPERSNQPRGDRDNQPRVDRSNQPRPERPANPPTGEAPRSRPERTDRQVNPAPAAPTAPPPSMVRQAPPPRTFSPPPPSAAVSRPAPVNNPLPQTRTFSPPPSSPAPSMHVSSPPPPPPAPRTRDAEVKEREN